MKKPAYFYFCPTYRLVWGGSTYASLGLYFGEQARLSQPVSIVNGSILVPLQVVADYLGGQVTWSARGQG